MKSTCRPSTTVQRLKQIAALFAVGLLILGGMVGATLSGIASVCPLTLTQAVSPPATLTVSVNQPTNLVLRGTRGPRPDTPASISASLTAPAPAVFVRTPHGVFSGGTVYSLDASLPAAGTYSISIVDSATSGESLEMTCTPAQQLSGRDFLIWAALAVLLVAIGCAILVGLAILRLAHAFGRTNRVTPELLS